MLLTYCLYFFYYTCLQIYYFESVLDIIICFYISCIVLYKTQQNSKMNSLLLTMSLLIVYFRDINMNVICIAEMFLEIDI